jgi:hypothetical protein
MSRRLLLWSITSAAVFAFFAGMMVLQLVCVKTQIIETKGVSLEGIQERLRQ